MESVFFLFLMVATLSVNSALIVYPANFVPELEAGVGEHDGNVSVTREHVSVSSSEVIARIMNSMPKVEAELETKPVLVKSSNQIVFENEDKSDKPSEGLRGGKIPPKDLETLNLTKFNEPLVSEESHPKTSVVNAKPPVEEHVNPVEDSSMQLLKNSGSIQHADVDHVEIPLESDKSHLHPSYLLEHFLSNVESEENGPIILKPKYARRKSIIAEIAERPCLHCVKPGDGLSMGRHAGEFSLNQQYRLADFVPGSEDTAIELDSRELMRRRRNFQRVSTLLPGHRSLSKTGPALLLPNAPNYKNQISGPTLGQFSKTSRSFWSNMLTFWPFGDKQHQAPSPNLVERLRIAPGVSKQKSIIGATIVPNSDDEIIIRPKPSPTPKPLVMEDILVPSSSNTFNTMNEIHEELNKQNTVKLQTSSPAHVASAGEIPAPIAVFPVSPHSFRRLLNFYTIVSSENGPNPTRAPAERESLAQAHPSPAPPIECPYLAHQLGRKRQP